MKLNGSDVRRINNAVSARTQHIALGVHKPDTLGEAAAMLHEMAHRLIVHRYEERSK